MSTEKSSPLSSFILRTLSPQARTEDEKVQSLIKEQTSIGEQSLIEEQPVEEEKDDMKKPTLGPPKKCPDGHRHISWSMGDDHIFCWDCNRKYSVSECFQPQESNLSESEEPND